MARKIPKPKPTPAPAFAAWAKAEEEKEFQRGREARAQFDAVRRECGEKGYLLVRDEHTGIYLLYVAVNSMAHPKVVGDMHFVRYIIEIDVHKQAIHVNRKMSEGPPPVRYGKPFSLESIVRAYVLAIGATSHAPTHAPRPAIDDAEGE